MKILHATTLSLAVATMALSTTTSVSASGA